MPLTWTTGFIKLSWCNNDELGSLECIKSVNYLLQFTATIHVCRLNAKQSNAPELRENIERAVTQAKLKQAKYKGVHEEFRFSGTFGNAGTKSVHIRQCHIQ